MRNSILCKAAVLAMMIGVISEVALASEMEAAIQSAFDGKLVKIENYDSQLKEIIVGSKSYFATHDGRYIFSGPIFDTKDRVDIVSAKENRHRSAFLNSQPNDLFVVYASDMQNSQELIVFTAIDCPYCRKFHNYMDEFNELGITIKYVMMPRGAVGSKAYKKTLSALCSNNAEKAITLAMQNRELVDVSCPSNRLESHIMLAKELSINSTPTIVLPNGALKLGLINPKQVVSLISNIE